MKRRQGSWEGFALTAPAHTPRGIHECDVIDALLRHRRLRFDEIRDVITEGEDYFAERYWEPFRGTGSRKTRFLVKMLRDMKQIGTLCYERPFWRLNRERRNGFPDLPEADRTTAPVRTSKKEGFRVSAYRGWTDINCFSYADSRFGSVSARQATTSLEVD